MSIRERSSFSSLSFGVTGRAPGQCVTHVKVGSHEGNRRDGRNMSERLVGQARQSSNTASRPVLFFLRTPRPGTAESVGHSSDLSRIDGDALFISNLTVNTPSGIFPSAGRLCCEPSVF